MIIGSIYKPPILSNRDFLDKFEENLHTISLSRKVNVRLWVMSDYGVKVSSRQELVTLPTQYLPSKRCALF